MIPQSPPNRPSLLRATVLVLVIALLPLPTPSLEANGNPLLQLEQADFILDDSPEPPPDSAAWRRQPLPDSWVVSHPGAFGHGWYRLRFVLSAEPDELYAAYVPLLETFGVLYVNGEHAGQTGAFERVSRAAQLSQPFVAGAPPVLLGYSPRLFSIRHGLLHEGTNTIHLRLWVKDGTRGALSGIAIGQEPLVRAVYEQRVLITVVGPRMIVLFSFGFGLFILLLWLPASA